MIRFPEKLDLSGIAPEKCLSQAQFAQYCEQGYVLLGSVLSAKQIEAAREEEARFRAAIWRGRKPSGTLFLSQLCHHSEIIRSIATQGAQVEYARQLVGHDLVLWFMQFVTKMPDQGEAKSEFPWHQDNGYADIINPRSNVTIWVALDDVDECNGCVWVVPGSHRQGLLDHRPASADNWHLNVPVEGDGIPARLQAGEAIAFTGLTLHRSKYNQTDKPRRGFFMEYADIRSRRGRTLQDTRDRAILDMPETIIVGGELPVDDYVARRVAA